MISHEDREHLLNQIEMHVGTEPIFFLKFCAKEKFANDIIDGNLYGNTAEYFRELEKKTGKRGQGDKYDVISVLGLQNIVAKDPETDRVVFVASSGQMKVEYGVDKKIPIVSFVGISLRDMILHNFDESHAEFRFPFAAEEQKCMRETFGEYCVMMEARELKPKIEQFCRNMGAEYVFGKVIYCPPHTRERLDAFNKGDKERFLYKDDDFKYQREYRLAIAIEMPNDHFIRLGKFDNAKIFPADEICNFELHLSYVSDVIGAS